jgi:hypothetical protein
VTRFPARAIAVGVAVLALGGLLAAADAPGGAFGVGVLRRDGVIVPFAAFTGRRWVDNWPLPDAEVIVPISVRDVPSAWWGPTAPLDRWQAWTASEPQALRVVQPDWVDAQCTRQIGLRADYKPALVPPPSTEQPYPKDGLAVSPPQPVERIAILRGESPEVHALIPAVHEAFNKAERRIEDRYPHPVERRAREGREPDIEAMYAAGEHPRIYYVEASRRYRLLGRPADQCEAVAFGTGWFTREGDAIRPLELSVDLLECNRAGASYMLPLGVMRLRGNTYWLAQFSGWDHERYVVVEVKSKSVRAVVNAWGGSCSR